MLFREAQAIVARLPPDQEEARRVLAYALRLLDFQDGVMQGEEISDGVVALDSRRLRAFGI
jgi:hypothetical protein